MYIYINMCIYMFVDYDVYISIYTYIYIHLYTYISMFSPRPMIYNLYVLYPRPSL